MGRIATIAISPYIFAQGELFKIEGDQAWVDVDGKLVKGKLI